MNSKWLKDVDCPEELKSYFDYVFILFYPTCDYCQKTIDIDREFESSDEWFIYSARKMKNHGWVIPYSQQAVCEECSKRLNIKHNLRAYEE